MPPVATSAKQAVLPDRGLVQVAGPDAEKLLQGIITNDMDLLGTQPAIHAALLTPQGKILFEFFVVRSGEGFLLETAKDQAANLVKRLGMYKLRAKVDIGEVDDGRNVLALWDTPQNPGENEGIVSFSDPRLPGLGWRIVVQSKSSSVVAARNALDVPALDYHAHRISLGVPEGGKDYAWGDAFPHEANFDLLNGVSFAKGCFVGQEVVSRMQHRGTARKRIVIIEAERPLQAGNEIAAGGAVIGTVGSMAGNRGLALVRLDRAQGAKADGKDMTSDGVKVLLHLPGYMHPANAPSAS